MFRESSWWTRAAPSPTPCSRSCAFASPADFETIDALAGAKERVVVGHDPEVAVRFEQVEPGIIKIA